MTEATLGFKIDSSQAVSGAADLDRLTAAANRTQQAADKLESEAASLGGALSRAGDGASKAAPPMERMAKSLADQDDHVRAFRLEVERLTMKYQPLAQATRSYQAAVSEIERAHKIGAINAQQMTQALDKERQAYEKLRTSAASAGAAVKAANSNNGVSGSQRAAGINAGYQFQDIAVTAAMGMNPLMIGLQQGTQLASVLGTMERPVAGLAAAFGSLINPVSLVTIGLTAGVAALVQYFTTAESGTGKTKKLFEEQNEVIRRAADLWGDATPALKAYVDQLDRADKLTQGRQAGEILAGRELDGLSKNLDSIQKQGVAAFRALQGDPQNAVIIRDLRQAWGDLRDRLNDGTASMADLNRVQQQLANAVSQYGVPAVLDFRDAFDKVTDSIYRGVEAAQKARTEWIKAIAGGTNVQDIVAGSTFTDGGRTYRASDFIPANVPTPGRRPLDLDQEPDAPTILNGDGRLTNVPVPGQKPNFFEIEDQTEKVDDLEKAYRRAQEAKADFWLDISFQQRQAERSAMDQQVAGTLNRYGFDEDLNSPEAKAIRQQLRGQQAKELAKSFGDAFSNELVSGSHDIGKSFLKGFESALTNEASKLWEKFFDGVGNIFANWITGAKGGGSSVSGASSIASAVLGSAANDNMGKAPVIPVTRAPLGDIASYISQAAAKRGIDPDIALRVAKSEGGLASWNLQSTYMKNGVQEPSFGPFQLYKGGGLGNDFMRKTGLDPALAANGPAGVDFALDHAAKNGWGAWYGAGKAGISNWQGIGTGSGANSAADAVNKLASSAGAATKGLDTFGGGLGKIGSALSSTSFPAAPSASGGGGGGGLFSWLGSLLGGGGQFAKAQAGLLKPGLFADGTNYAPGGLAVVGERGPELVNLPQGSQVFNTNRSAQMMGGSNDNGPRQDRKLEIHVHGGSGDEHVRELARQGAQEALYQDKIDQARGSFGSTQKKFNSRVG
ncbi:phage tail length tape measure family protein [Rhizobium redzepovicii]|uniref:phage tail length tape measure family protein n=1 Tax=Rhizobium redzepovicii TaxID=2867518 RepID=UPI00287194E1|nr:phage tail length tape measure family protein [Rhizobium redzepovicii]MDR9781587.1 phage tail length tape measure family protein [Rhizobium redzepovicii]